MLPQVNLSLQGKRALICGASAGIGRATAELFATHGASVVVLSRSAEKLTQLLASLPGSGHTAIVVDQNDHESLRAKVGHEISQRGAINVLINNSAGPRGGPIAESSAQDFEAAFKQHLLTNHLLAQVVLPEMKKQNNGRIINVISTSVRVPIPGLGVSNTIRGAVASWAKTLSLEVGAAGITVNSVLPGYTRTERLAALLKAESDKTGKSLSEVESDWQRTVPLKRFAEPAEVAAAILFLASPAASYISGVTLAVDGGRTPSI